MFKRESPELPPSMPDFYANEFWSLISDPEEEPRLKTFFDNARNYGIAVAVGTGGALVWKGADGIAAFGAGAFLIVVGSLLGVLNVLQSWVLFMRTFHMHVGLHYGLESQWSSMLKILTIMACMALIPASAWCLVQTLLNNANK